MSRRPACRFPRNPCPRSARSVPFASSRPLSATSVWWWPRHTTSSGRSNGRRSWPAIRPTSSAWTCRPRSRAKTRTTATDGRRARWRRGARTGPCARIRTRRSTSTSRPTSSPAPTVERTQRGFFARLRLEAFGEGSGVLPHERTLTGPKEDRYKLLRATGVNTSPVVGLFDDRSGATEERLAAVAAGPPAIEVTDDDGVRHRLWARGGRRRGSASGGRRGAHRCRRQAARSPSPTATTATRRRSATATSGG